MRAFLKRLESRAGLTFAKDRPIRSLSALAPVRREFPTRVVLGSHAFSELSVYTCGCVLWQQGPCAIWVQLPRATRTVGKGLIRCQARLFCSLKLPGSSGFTCTGAYGRSVLALQDTSLLSVQNWNVLRGRWFPSPAAIAVQGGCVPWHLAGGSRRGRSSQAKACASSMLIINFMNRLVGLG